MKILVLGSGNAWGMPNPYCECKICDKIKSQEDSKDYRLRTSLYVETDSKGVLVDCGPDFLIQAKKYNLNKIDSLLITHSHRDHVGGLDDLFVFKRSTNHSVRMPLPTYLHEKTLEELLEKQGLGYMFEDPSKNITESNKPLYPILVKENQQYALSQNCKMIPIKTLHGEYCKGSVGYFIQETTCPSRSLFYTSDLSDFDHDIQFESLIKYIKEKQSVKDLPKPLYIHDLSGRFGIDDLIIECNWFNEPLNNRCGHMSLQRSLSIIKKLDPKRVFYIHFSDEDIAKGESITDFPHKREALSPLPCNVPRTHEEWDLASRYIFKELSLQKYLNQKDIICYDGRVL